MDPSVSFLIYKDHLRPLAVTYKWARSRYSDPFPTSRPTLTRSSVHPCSLEILSPHRGFVEVAVRRRVIGFLPMRTLRRGIDA